jgi:hypothetical protein
MWWLEAARDGGDAINRVGHRRPTAEHACTTGNPDFAESLSLSAKATKPSAQPLPRVALGKGSTGNFFSTTILCRAPEL